MNNPITVHEAAEAVYDMVGSAADFASPLTATDWHLHGHQFTVTLAREHNGNQTDRRNFVVTINANEDNPVLSHKPKPADEYAPNSNTTRPSSPMRLGSYSSTPPASATRTNNSSSESSAPSEATRPPDGRSTSTTRPSREPEP